MTPALQVLGITKSYTGRDPAVRDCSFDVGPGEFVALLGPSGCGKTTTLRVIAGFVKPDTGRVVLGGEDITARPANRRNVGLVFQNYSLFPHLSVGANVAYGLRTRRVRKPERASRVSEALSLVRLSGRENDYPRQMSGGEQQRVALARAIVVRPAALLLDEPLSNLDARLRATLRFELRELQQRLGITTIIVTHDQDEALTMADRIVVLNKGRIEQIGTPEAVYATPATSFVAGFIGDRNSMACTVMSVGGGEATVKTDAGTVLTVSCNGSLLGREARALLAIRTDEIGLDGGSGGAEPALDRTSGTVEARTYLGSVVAYRVRVGDDVFRVVRGVSAPGVDPKAGDTVSLSWPRNACRLLAHD